jgi:hypothetical protein
MMDRVQKARNKTVGKGKVAVSTANHGKACTMHDLLYGS